MAEERLQKYLAQAGVASRRASEKLILDGHVRVNGKVIREMGTKVVPGKDQVEVDGKPVVLEEKTVYVLLNKPTGYVTTVKDPQNRLTVMDLIKDIPYRVYPVGRLDFETEGLLLLTNDGELAYRMTHPKFELKKTYVAWVEGAVKEESIRILCDGVVLEDGKTAPAEVKILRREKKKTQVEITIHEGKNRQVRRMLQAVNHPVIMLRRISAGNLKLKGLQTGEYRYLTQDEERVLKNRLGLSQNVGQADS